MPAWYDILEMSIDRRVDTEQLLHSAAAVTALVDREIERGIDSRRIIIAGFSQGGAVGYQVALTYPQPLAGLLALSTYFATAEQIQPHAANQGLAIEIHHGSHDPVVPEALGEQARDVLTQRGYPVAYRSYPMEHQVVLEQIHDIGRWLRERLA